MTDKVQKIREEVERLKESGCASPIVICDTLLAFIDSLQEEPVKIKKGCKYLCLGDMFNNDTGKISFIGGKIYLAPEDNTLVSEENGWRCDTSENASNFELVEEPISIWHDASEKPERDDLLIETNDGRLIHRKSINNYGMVKRWAYASDLLNLDNSCNFGKNLQEELKDKCNGCNNVKGCITCVDGSEWAHLKEASKNYADKEKFRKEVEKLKSNLIYGACSSQIAMETTCKEEAFNEVLAILDTMQEEPVSEELEDEYNNYIDIHDGEWTKDDYLAFARHFANWGSKHHKPIGEDFEKVVSDFLDQYTYPREEVDFLQFALYINSWAREQISKHYYLNIQDLDIAAEKCEESWVKVGIEPQKKGDYVSIFKAGAKWQRQQDNNDANHALVEQTKTQQMCYEKGMADMKQQMMEDAVDGRFSYNPNFKENEFICLEKSDTPEHYLGELVKVIIIKQEEE